MTQSCWKSSVSMKCLAPDYHSLKMKNPENSWQKRTKLSAVFKLNQCCWSRSAVLLNHSTVQMPWYNARLLLTPISPLDLGGWWVAPLSSHPRTQAFLIRRFTFLQGLWVYSCFSNGQEKGTRLSGGPGCSSCHFHSFLLGENLVIWPYLNWRRGWKLESSWMPRK